MNCTNNELFTILKTNQNYIWLLRGGFNKTKTFPLWNSPQGGGGQRFSIIFWWEKMVIFQNCQNNAHCKLTPIFSVMKQWVYPSYSPNLELKLSKQHIMEYYPSNLELKLSKQQVIECYPPNLS